MNKSALASLIASHHFFIRRVRFTKADVFHHGGAEQECILQHDTDLLTQRFNGHVADIHAIDLDRAVRYIMDPAVF